jgi:hypothetical protein
VRRKNEGDRHLYIALGTVQYGPRQKGVPALQSIRRTFQAGESTFITYATDVQALRFEPTPDEEFQPATYGIEPPGEGVWAAITRAATGSAGAAAAIVALLAGLWVFRKPARPTVEDG